MKLLACVLIAAVLASLQIAGKENFTTKVSKQKYTYLDVELSSIEKELTIWYKGKKILVIHNPESRNAPKTTVNGVPIEWISSLDIKTDGELIFKSE